MAAAQRPHGDDPVPAAERTESVRHMLDHYQPYDFPTWQEVSDNNVWDHPSVRALVEDVRQHGVRRPIPVDYEMDPPMVRNGHTRLLAAERAGVTHVPVRQYVHYADPDDDSPHWHEEWNARTASGVEDYGMSHRPLHDGAPAYDLTEGYQEDIYTHPHYWAGESPVGRSSREGLDQLRKARGNPDYPVTIYRASPADAPYRMHAGDWVSLSPAYARMHAESEGHVTGDWHVHRAVVPARHVRDAGTDQYREQGYWGPDVDSEHHWGPRPEISREAAYRGFHQAPGGLDDDATAPMHDVRNMMPDAYEHPEWYGNHDPESRRQIVRAEGKPDLPVHVYRALPESRREINDGDWVTTSAAYARLHGESNLSRHTPWHVIRAVVPARQLFSEGNFLAEWGYRGEQLQGERHAGPFGQHQVEAAVVAHFEEPVTAAAESDPPYDWAEALRQLRYRKQNEPEMHRGLAVTLPPELHTMVTDRFQGPPHRQARAIADHLRAQGLGTHWTPNEKVSRFFAAGESRRQPGSMKVILHARLPEVEHIETDPAKLGEGGVFRHDNWMSGEKEIPLREGAPVHLTGVTWYGYRNRKVRGDLNGEEHTASVRATGELSDDEVRSGLSLPSAEEGHRDLQKEKLEHFKDKFDKLFLGDEDDWESYRLNVANENAMDLRRRYEGGSGTHGFSANEGDEPGAESGSPYYEIRHRDQGGRDTGWRIRHYNDGPLAEIEHAGTPGESHESIELPRESYASNSPHEWFGHEHLHKMLHAWHAGTLDPDEPDENRKYLEGPYGEPGIRRWQRRHLGAATGVVAHFEDGEPLPAVTAAVYEPKPKWEPYPEGASDEERSADYDRQSKIRHEWEAKVNHGMSTGQLSGQRAKELGHYFNGDQTDRYGDPTWRPLPEHLYHVTTDLEGVRQHGLRTRRELGQLYGHGLGGGPDEMISMAADYGQAQNILRAMHEFHHVVNGRYTPAEMWEDAKAGVKADHPFHREMASYWQSDWKDGDPLPRGLHNTIHQVHRDSTGGSTQEDVDAARGPGWRPARDDEGWMSGHKPPRKVHAWWERDMTPDESRENAASFYKHFAFWRAHAGGPEDPLFFSTDTRSFAQKDPRNFAIVHLRPRPGGHGYPLEGGALSEWRTGSGDAVEAHRAERMEGHNLREASLSPLVAHFEGHVPEPLGPGPYMQQKLFHMQPDPTLNEPGSGRHNPEDPEAGYRYRAEHDPEYHPDSCEHCGGDRNMSRQHAEEHGDWLHEQDWHTDWDAETLPDNIHRGIGASLPEHVHSVVHDDSRPVAERARVLAHHLLGSGNVEGSGLGNFWSSDPDVSKTYAETAGRRYSRHGAQTPVMFHARTPGMEHIETDPETLQHWGVYSYHLAGNREVPVRHQAPLHVTGISWAPPGHQVSDPSPHDPAWHDPGPHRFDQDPLWTHHEFSGGIQANASVAAALAGGPDQVSAREERGDRWHEYQGRYLPDVLHRGIHVRLPEDLHAYVHDEGEPRGERAAALAAHLGQHGLGMHWTPHLQVARRATANSADRDDSAYGSYALEHGFADEGDEPEVHQGYFEDEEPGEDGDDMGGGRRNTDVIFHVRQPGQRNRLPVRERAQYGISDSTDESEFPMRPGTPLRLTGISWREHDPRYPMESYNHHDFGKPMRHVSSVIPAQDALPAVVAHFGDDEGWDDEEPEEEPYRRVAPEEDEHGFQWPVREGEHSGVRERIPGEAPRCTECARDAHSGYEWHWPEDGHHPDVQARMDRDREREERWDRGEYDRTRFCGVGCEQGHHEDQRHGVSTAHTFSVGEPEWADNPHPLDVDLWRRDPHSQDPHAEPADRRDSRYEVRDPSAEHRCHYCRSILPQYRRQASAVTAGYDYDTDEGPFTWDEIARRHPRVYGDDEDHAPGMGEGGGEDIADAAAELYHDRPSHPYSQTTGELHPYYAGPEDEMQFHPRTVDVNRIDYIREEPSDPRVSRARRGFQDYRQREKIPPLVLVHRHGVYHVADGHHRANGAAQAGWPSVRAYVAYSPHEDEPFAGRDGEPPQKGPFHGAETRNRPPMTDHNGDPARPVSFLGFPHTTERPRPQRHEASAAYEDVFLHGMRVTPEEARAHLLHSHHIDMSGIEARNSDLYNLHETQHPFDGPAADEHLPAGQRYRMPLGERQDLREPAADWEEGDDATSNPFTASRVTGHRDDGLEGLPVQGHFDYYAGSDWGYRHKRVRSLQRHLYDDHFLPKGRIPGFGRLSDDPEGDQSRYPELAEAHRDAHRDEEEREQPPEESESLRHVREEHAREESRQRQHAAEQAREGLDFTPEGAGSYRAPREGPIDPVFGSVTATRNHWDMTEDGMRHHLRDEHGIADPGEDPASVHWDEHSGDTQRHVHPDLEQEFVRAMNPGIPQGDAFIYTPDPEGGHDPVFGSRQGRALESHFSPALAPAIAAAAALGSWEPSAGEAAEAARDVPRLFTALRDGILRTARLLEEAPVHPDVPEALHQAARSLSVAAADAARTARALPTEASWEEPAARPNR